ncbi:hypothetical protein GFGA_1c0278 [Gluconobacter frateurii NBRC 103465]|nr:hypothetical protein GFGA_1c0278 [Gluconobacter frateurii NBRC 103465]
MILLFRRYRSAFLASLLLCAGSGTAAYADDHPRLSPARDVTVTYHLSAPGMQGAGGDVKVYFSGSGDLLRIDSADGRGITILDRPKQVVTLVMLERKLYAHIRPQHGLHNPFMLDLGMKYTKAGQATIAGVPCGRWDIQTAHGKASACVTEDGVILSENGVDADGAEGSIQATNVAYGDLPTATFEPPAGFQEITPRTSPHHSSAGGSQSTSPTPAPVPEGGAAGDSAVQAPGHIAAQGTPAETSAPVVPPVSPEDASQPSVSNDSAADGTVSTPDQPPSGPSSGGQN